MKIAILITLILSGFILLSFAQTKNPSAQVANTPPPKDPAFEEVIDVKDLPRVLLIGDSITIGYTVPVRKILGTKANIHRIPDNGGPTTNGLANLHKWLGDGHWDVIHFNWGLHDLKIMGDGKQQVSLEEYEKNLRTLVSVLKGTGAKLIWAATTPVPEGVENPVRHPADVMIYNAIAKRIMDENDILIDDLYSFALPLLSQIQRPKNVHFSDEGSAVLAKQVTATIASALPKKN